MDQQHPSIPQGAVDLADPVQLCISQFKVAMAKANCVAVILIGQSADGSVSMAQQLTGGMVQALGMLGMAQAMLGQMARPQRDE